MQVDDSDSDGSDYDPEEEDAAGLEVDDDDDVHLRTKYTSLVRVINNGVIIHDVPIPKDYCANPYLISVAQLEEEICSHIRKGTLQDALTKVDITSKVFSNPQYPPREIQLGKARYPPRETRYQVIQKTYGTPLHYACHDPNGSRGEHKIRFLMWVANHYKIPTSQILPLSEVTVRKYGTEWHELCIEERTKMRDQRRVTPLYILLDNPNSSINAIRLLVNAWPTVIHMQYFTDFDMECHNTLSHVLLQDAVSDNHLAEDHASRVLAIAKVLLEVASKTNLGIKGLIAANTKEYEMSEETWNSIHVALARGNCLKILTTMLQIWPEAVQESGNSYKSDRSCPLYSILHHYPQTTQSCLWQAKCIKAILQHSSLESVTMGLLRTGDSGRTQFQDLVKVIYRLQASAETELTELVDDLLEAFTAIIPKRDANGKAMLHHVVVAPDFRWSAPPEYHRSMTNAFKRRRRYKANCHNNMDLVQWILQEEPSQPFVRDNEGQNPLHVALKSGGTWHDGIRAMIELVPDWQYEPTKRNGEQDDLLPFQIAATAVDPTNGTVDTIYELLKITGPRAFSDLIL